MTTATIYRAALTNHMNHLQNINAAYKLAGVKTPTRGPAFRKVVDNIDTPEQVVNKQIRDGLDTVTTDKQLQDWHTKTVAAVSEAIAAERLKKAFPNQYDAIQRARATDYATQAVEDLQKPFADFIAQFSKAAKALPAGTAALDPEACIAHDAGAHLTTARDALAKLGLFAGLILTKQVHGNHPKQLAQLAKIVHYPKANKEILEGLGRSTRNPGQLKGTFTIRQLETDIRKQGLDLALVNIARGDYPGITFQLADNTEHLARVENLHFAFSREVLDESPTGKQRREQKAHQETIMFAPGH